MNWINRVLNKLLLIICDDNGQPSVKRTIALLLAFAVVYVIVYTSFHVNLETFTWDSTVVLLTSIFGCISVLVGVTAFERRNILKMGPESKEEEKKPN